MNLKERIIEYSSDKDMYWAFDNKEPYYILKTNKEYGGRHVNVDPFPCAKHDKHLIKHYAEIIESKFPVGSLVYYHIIPNETVGRSNAWASYETYYTGDKEQKFKDKYLMEGIILFSGKRTICHPAMTKYLVAHEYGHIVDYWIRKQLQIELNSDKDMTTHFHDMYSKMRGIKNKPGYGGGRWTNSIVEIIADDFRIVVGETDPEFYPHSCKHPLESPKVIEFWKELHTKYSKK